MSNAGNAQSFRRGGTEFNAMRTVELGSSKSFAAVVTEFFHHGEIAPDGRNVVVAAKNQLVPCRVLQLGPGDFCRLAFQPIKGQTEYNILYGGDPPAEKVRRHGPARMACFWRHGDIKTAICKTSNRCAGRSNRPRHSAAIMWKACSTAVIHFP